MSDAARMLEFCVTGGIVVAKVLREMLTDEDNLEAFGNEIQQALIQAGGNHIVLDISNLEHVTSAVLGKWIQLHRSVHRDGGHMVIANACPALMEILEATRLNSLFTLSATVDDAVALMRA